MHEQSLFNPRKCFSVSHNMASLLLGTLDNTTLEGHFEQQITVKSTKI